MMISIALLNEIEITIFGRCEEQKLGAVPELEQRTISLRVDGEIQSTDCSFDWL